MPEHSNKRKGDGGDKARRRYRHDGTPIQQHISGPGIWVTCVRGKERGASGELSELFENYAAEMWPAEATNSSASVIDDDSDEADEDIEKQIAKEMSNMKRPKKEKRFANCQTNTPCFVVISCKPPIDPIKLVVRHVETVLETGVTKTRSTQRITPISGTCVTNIQEIKALCTRLIEPYLTQANSQDSKFSYKIELRMRNHNTLTRQTIIEEVAKCVPTEHKVDLESPEVFILVEIWKSICGIGIVRDYYKLQKFNVMEIAKAEEPGFKSGDTRIKESGKAKPEISDE